MFKKVFLLTLLALPIVGLFQYPAMACSCVKRSVDEKLALADAAFVGKLTDRKVVSQSAANGTVLTFRAERVVKGVLPEVVKVRSAASGASCGLEVAEGKKVGLYLRREGGNLNSSLCNQESADDLIAQAGPGRLPVDISGSSTSGWQPVAGALFLGAVAIMVARVLQSKGRFFFD